MSAASSVLAAEVVGTPVGAGRGEARIPVKRRKTLSRKEECILESVDLRERQREDFR